MIKSTAHRQKAVKAAVGSVRAEGLKPSKSVRKDLKSFASGRMTLNTVRKNTITRIAHSRHSAK